MNEKPSMFVILGEAIICLFLYNLHDLPLNNWKEKCFWKLSENSLIYEKQSGSQAAPSIDHVRRFARFGTICTIWKT